MRYAISKYPQFMLKKIGTFNCVESMYLYNEKKI